MKDITGMSPPSKPVVRFDSKGYRTKVWYRNGSGMLWRWFFYFTDPAEAVDGALEAGRKAEADAKAEADRQAETDRLFWRAMRTSVKDMAERFGQSKSDEIVITRV